VLKQKSIQWQRGIFRINTELEALDLVTVHHFLSEAPWSHGISASMLRTALENSLCFSLFENHKQIGLARVITDYTTYAYLCDVYLQEEFRAQGLGSWLIRCVLEHPQLKNLRRISLLTHDAQKFYERFEFEPLDRPERYMERILAEAS
jgi:ribosomal protein S18 acetylase RimI-like enzyme